MIEGITSVEFLAFIQGLAILILYIFMQMYRQCLMDMINSIHIMDRIIRDYEDIYGVSNLVSYTRLGLPKSTDRIHKVIAAISAVCVLGIPITTYIMVVSK